MNKWTHNRKARERSLACLEHRGQGGRKEAGNSFGIISWRASEVRLRTLDIIDLIKLSVKNFQET